MIWNDHSVEVPEGTHAFLGASTYSWLNYDEKKLEDVYRNNLAKARGTRLHAFAAECISLGQKLPPSKKTLNQYVNDAIHFKMQPEQVLYYSENCFGTADAISFKKDLLRIHDLKTGKTKPSLHQLEIYAALFCLEYDKKPGSIDIELRIYYENDVLVGKPTASDILPIMDKIIIFDKKIEQINSEEM